MPYELLIDLHLKSISTDQYGLFPHLDGHRLFLLLPVVSYLFFFKVVTIPLPPLNSKISKHTNNRNIRIYSEL